MINLILKLVQYNRRQSVEESRTKAEAYKLRNIQAILCFEKYCWKLILLFRI